VVGQLNCGKTILEGESVENPAVSALFLAKTFFSVIASVNPAIDEMFRTYEERTDRIGSAVETFARYRKTLFAQRALMMKHATDNRLSALHFVHLLRQRISKTPRTS
jgi:hypothetical protein